MQSHSLSRELALLMLGQVDDRGSKPMPPSDLSMEALLHQVQASLALHVREALDHSAGDLEQAQQQLLDSELQQEGEQSLPRVRTQAVLQQREDLDVRLDRVMEGWRLTRLPRIDRDILRLAAVDLEQFGTPLAVACSEAVELANRYSDEQGRRMINGVLRRFTNATKV